MDLDLAVQQNHPVLQEEQVEGQEEEVNGVVPLYLPAVQEDTDPNPQESEEDTTDTEEDVFAKSS